MTAAVSVKICGITQETEIDALARLGVEFVGLVVGLDVDYAIGTKRAAALVAHAGLRTRGTIVTKEHNVDSLARLVEATGAPAIQLAGFTSARRVARLRQILDRPQMTIMQVIHFQGDRAVEQGNIAAYADAGVDYFILDRVGDDGALGSTGKTIDTTALKMFRKQMTCSVPVLVAGGVDVTNVNDLMVAAGAVGIDVSSSIRKSDGVDIDKVATLLGAVP